MLEIEKTYLAKSIPEGLAACAHKELLDVYVPRESAHAHLRIRKNGDRHEITKKTPINPNDASQLKEETIVLTADEFNALASVPGKRIRKIRYLYPYQGMTAEVDVFQDSLAGLVVVDFEFDSPEAQRAFVMPEFCLADITQEDFIAGGVLCGKKYQDIQAELERFNYKPLTV